MLLALTLAAPAVAQDTQPASDPEHSRALEQARTIITDTKASPEVRRIGAEHLLELNSPAAIDLAIDLLGGNGDPLPGIALCEAITAVSARQPELLDSRLVQPLLELLGSPDEQMRRVAARALSGFPDGQVAQKLGELAADGQAKVDQRLAAVDALAPNVHRRQVVHQLVLLLDSELAEVRSRALAALGPASRMDCGEDIDCWKQWWRDKAALDDRQWLQDRVDLLRQQNRRAQDALVRLRAASERRVQQLSRRLRDELEHHYRLTPQPQQEELLIRWLEDPSVECRAASVTQIAANISDGNRPSAAFRAALRQRFDDDSAELRRAVFDVIAALTDPEDVEAVRARLEQEAVPAVREAILRTLGRLQNPAAIEPLTAELANPQATEACLLEAAVSLGLLGAREKADPAVIAVAIRPLKERFAVTPADRIRLRASLLGAMASIGAAEFAEEFLANLDADESDLLLPALEGVKTVGNATRIDRVLALTASNDARVRRRAIEALAVLGGEQTHVEALLSRLNPAAEPNEAVRQAAWGGFCAALADRPPQERLQWAGRLTDLPEREEEYLADLMDDLAGAQSAAAELPAVRRRLAELYDVQDRHAESFPLWRELWQSSIQADDPTIGEVGASYLRAMLRAGRYEKLLELLPALLAGPGETAVAEVRTALLGHLQALQAAGDHQQLDLYLDGLGRLSSDDLGPELRQVVNEARTKLASPSAPEETTPS